jgi:hypothetical protein
MMRVLIISVCLCLTLSSCDSTPDDAKTHIAKALTSESAVAATQEDARKAPKHDASVINFKGFGPAKFGDNEESVRMSWGRPLTAGETAVGATCYYLFKESTPALANTHQRGIKFMMEDGQFVRYDVDDTSFVAPGDIVVGDTLDKILRVHQAFTQVQPHKYIEGAKMVIITEVALTETSHTAKLIFELDAQDQVIEWRIGVAPQVYYVEGCG